MPNMSSVAHEFPPCRMNFAEFLEWVSIASVKHEYLHGVVYGMAGGTRAHSTLIAAIITQLSNNFLPIGCDVLSDILVTNPGKTAGFFPDASVVCGPVDATQIQSSVIASPCIVVEVLSKFTRNYDQGDKSLEYKKISTMQYYLLVDSQKMYLQLHARESNGSWRVTELTERSEYLYLPVYEVRISMDTIYGRIRFDNAEAN